MDDLVTYMGYEWIHVDDTLLTVGVNDEGLEEFTEINGIDLPAEGQEVSPDEVCGEIDTDQGPLNIYSPVEGTVAEVNEAVLNNPSLVADDNFGDGWLFRVEADSKKQVDQLTSGSRSDSDDEDEDESEEEQESEAE